jgi:hypothetical protein
MEKEFEEVKLCPKLSVLITNITVAVAKPKISSIRLTGETAI